MHQTIAKQIGIAPVNTNHADPFHTAFYDSIDAIPALGITTGISAKERAITARQVVDPAAKPADFIKPGHLFPVVAKEGGLLVRKGHTEAAVDLCLLTDLAPAAIICEIMDKHKLELPLRAYMPARRETIKILNATYKSRADSEVPRAAEAAE
jgi:3,4-dihydroxy 2-butanone 4-phosphate synthase/GTP cyclohydrolase II